MLKTFIMPRFCQLTLVRPQTKFSSSRNRFLVLNSARVNKEFIYSNTYQIRQTRQFQLNSILEKYNKNSQDIDSDDEDNEFDFKDERDSKVVKTKVNSLRADLLLKAGLGMARNKVETFFYESKIRVNGKKLAKKSAQLNVGDEIDVVRGFSQTNPTHLIVSRVIILSASERESETLSVQLRRYKSLLIENYASSNAYKSSETTVHKN